MQDKIVEENLISKIWKKTKEEPPSLWDIAMSLANFSVVIVACFLIVWAYVERAGRQTYSLVELASNAPKLNLLAGMTDIKDNGDITIAIPEGLGNFNVLTGRVQFTLQSDGNIAVRKRYHRSDKDNDNVLYALSDLPPRFSTLGLKCLSKDSAGLWSKAGPAGYPDIFKTEQDSKGC